VYGKKLDSYSNYSLYLRIKLTSWLTENFIFTDTEWLAAGKQWGERGSFSVKLFATRRPLTSPDVNPTPWTVIEVQPNGEGVIRMDNIESCGNMLQSICSHLNVKYVQSRAFFPHVLDLVENAINTVAMP
jgi:hypothetical protein